MQQAPGGPTGRAEAITAVMLLAITTMVWMDLARQTVAAEAINGIQEIVFTVRQPGHGGHWYENFGNTAFEPNKLISGAMGRLCRLNTATLSNACTVS